MQTIDNNTPIKVMTLKPKLFQISMFLDEAIKKGAHQTEKSQRAFISDAVITALYALNNPAITALVDQHCTLEEA